MTEKSVHGLCEETDRPGRSSGDFLNPIEEMIKLSSVVCCLSVSVCKEFLR